MYMLRMLLMQFTFLSYIVELDSFDDAFFFEPNIFELSFVLSTPLAVVLPLGWIINEGRCNLAQRAS